MVRLLVSRTAGDGLNELCRRFLRGLTSQPTGRLSRCDLEDTAGSS